MNPVIAGWLEELDTNEADARSLTDQLSEGQFTWRPGPGRWSIGECFDHLAITTGLVTANVRAALDRGRVEGKKGDPPYGFGLIGGWFVRVMERPGKRAMPSPENFVPPYGGAKSAVLGKFFAAQREFRDALESAPGLPLAKLKAPSTAKGAGWLKLKLAAWFASTLAHQRRHLAQARRVTQTQGFPRVE